VSDALRARGATVDLGGRRVLDDVTFEVGRGEFACLCGPNGGGKTTFLKAALGLVPLSAGEIEVLGVRPGVSASAVGYLLQAKGFNSAFPVWVVELIVANRRGVWPVRLGAADREAVCVALVCVGGEACFDERIRGVSGAAAGLPRPRPRERAALLLLDEPTAGVDAWPGRVPRPLAGVAPATTCRGARHSTTRNAAAREEGSTSTGASGRGEHRRRARPEWDRAAFGGPDHDSHPGRLCEDE
jgi:ABC-type iron transport system FetAB ATPase subunit